MLLALASYIARRTAPWPRRVFFPNREVLKAWGAPDRREPLHSDTVGALIALMRAELVSRAMARRNFARAVIDRGLVDLLVPIDEHATSKARIAWPRGSEITLPDAAPGTPVRWFVHWENPSGMQVDLELSAEMFDGAWRHVATCDARNLVVGDRVVVHSEGLTSAPSPRGASKFVELDLDRLRELGVRHAVMVVFSYNSIPFDRLTYGFAGFVLRPREGAAFDPRTVAQRFDLHGKSVITVPLAIDLEARRRRLSRRARPRRTRLRRPLPHRGTAHPVGPRDAPRRRAREHRLHP
jgi:hypothetical protein